MIFFFLTDTGTGVMISVWTVIFSFRFTIFTEYKKMLCTLSALYSWENGASEYILEIKSYS